MAPNEHSITIVGMTIIRRLQVNQMGGYVIARFDCEVNGFMLIGCCIARTPKQGLVAWPPRIDTPREDNAGERRRSAVTIIDNTLRHQLLDVARKTYIAMGGKHAEWIPQGDDDPVLQVSEAQS